MHNSDQDAAQPDAAVLQQRIESDLRWTLGAGALVDASFWQDCGVQLASCAGWRMPPTLAPLAPGNGILSWRQGARLGHHFERIHAGLLGAQPDVIVHALNYPLQSASGTLGELDCLYSSAAGEVVHREVAVKYFLACKESESASDWVGTSKIDRLDLKLRRLAEHQTQLSLVAREQAAWPLELPFPARREVLLLGAFFRHPSHAAWPRVAGPDAERGFWCDSDEFVRQAGQASAWTCFHKPWWLSKEHGGLAPRQSAHEIAASVEQNQQAVLVGRQDADEGIFRGRGFVVPRGWNAP